MDIIKILDKRLCDRTGHFEYEIEYKNQGESHIQRAWVKLEAIVHDLDRLLREFNWTSNAKDVKDYKTDQASRESILQAIVEMEIEHHAGLVPSLPTSDENQRSIMNNVLRDFDLYCSSYCVNHMIKKN